MPFICTGPGKEFCLLLDLFLLQCRQCGFQLCNVSVGEAVPVHAAGTGAVNIELQIIDKEAFGRIQSEPFKQMLIDLFLRFDAFYFGREENAVKTFYGRDHCFITVQQARGSVGADIEPISPRFQLPYQRLYFRYRPHIILMPVGQTECGSFMKPLWKTSADLGESLPVREDTHI